MGPRFKDRLTNLFEESPLLRVLVWDSRFRWAGLAFVLVVVGCSLALLKIWPSTPPHLPWVVRISGVDYIQSWTLRRNAEKEQAMGDLVRALMSWEMARANNPGDPELTRGIFRTKLLLTNSVADARAAQDGSWLLVLTRTNTPDLELVTRYYARLRMHRDIVGLLRAEYLPLPTVLERAYAKSLFALGDIEGFKLSWQRLGTEASADPELELLGKALQAGEGRDERSARAKEALEQVAGAPGPLHAVANRACILVGARLRDSETVRMALDRLKVSGADSPADHLVYWRLLVASGSCEEAGVAMGRYPAKPGNTAETKAWADLWLACGKTEAAEALLNWALENQPVDPVLRVLHGQILTRAKRWEELANLGHAMRVRSGAAVASIGFGYYLEARSAVAGGRQFDAQRAVSAIVSLDADAAGFGLEMGRGLLDSGFTVEAIQVLRKCESSWTKSAAYWSVLCAAANRVLDEKTFTEAAQRLYELEPRNMMAVNSYACSLLIQRQNAGEAIALTSHLFRERPRNLAVALNLVSALLMGGRAEEARNLMSRIRPERLSRAEMAQYHFTRFELGAQLGDPGLAWDAYDKTDRSVLFASQVRWLDATVASLGKRQGAPAVPTAAVEAPPVLASSGTSSNSIGASPAEPVPEPMFEPPAEVATTAEPGVAVGAGASDPRPSAPSQFGFGAWTSAGYRFAPQFFILGLLVVALGGAGYMSARYRSILARRALKKTTASSSVQPLARVVESDVATSKVSPLSAQDPVLEAIDPVVVTPGPSAIVTVEETPADFSTSPAQGQVSSAVTGSTEIGRKEVVLPAEQAVSASSAALEAPPVASLQAEANAATTGASLATPSTTVSTEPANEAGVPRRRDELFASLKARRTPSQLAAAELFKVKRTRVRRSVATDGDPGSTRNTG